MRFRRIPQQIILLVIVLVAAVTALVLARRAFVPETFGREGHFRAAAVTPILQQPLQYAGSQACQECHDGVTAAKDAAYHRSLSCEVCHGPAAGHAEVPGESSPSIPRGRTFCLYGHSYLPSRPTGFPQIIELAHNPPQQCTGCHDPHDPTPPQAPGACSACHASIARMKAVSHHDSRACETCHETPSEHKIDPRRFPARKPVTREHCARCHARDAQSPAPIPRIDPDTHGGRYPCWQCHYPHFPEGR